MFDSDHNILVSKNGMRPLTDANDTEPPAHTNGLGGMNGVGGGAYFANGTALHYDFDDTSNPFDDAFRHDSDPNCQYHQFLYVYDNDVAQPR